MSRFGVRAPVVVFAALLALPRSGAAQSPVITPQGDPSVKPDSIYKLAVNPADYPDETAAFLLDDGVIRLNADGTGTRTFRQIVQLLRPEAAERYREQRFSYAPKHQKFTLNWIRVVKPDGTVISAKPLQVQESDVPAQLGDPTYSDRKVIRVSLTGVEAGTLVDYSTTTEELKPFLRGDFLESWSISTGLATKRSRYIVDVPASLKVRVDEKNVRFKRGDVKIGDRRIMTWAANDLPKIKPEDYAADSNDVYMSVLISSPTTWEDIGKWYATNAKDRYVLTPAVEAKLKDVVAKSKTFDDSLRAIHKWIAQDIRYVSIALGLGGYQPRTPGTVVETGFGDCKDKATIFVAALTRIGVTAYPVLLSAEGGVRRGYPSIEQFDHAIAAYKRPGATKYEYADLTASLTPLGELPFSEQGEMGLVVHPDGSTEEITFPKVPISGNRRVTRVTGTLSSAGMFEGSLEEVSYGALQYETRSAFENPVDTAARRKMANAVAGKWFEGAEGDSLVVIEGKDLAATARIGVAIHHGKAASLAGNTVVLKNPFGTMSGMLLAAKELENKPKRLFPIDPVKILGYDDITIELRMTLPEGWKAQLPPSIKAGGVFGLIETSYAQNGRELLFTRRLVGATGVQPPDQVAALVAWFREVGKDDASLIIIQKS
jgi:transglutaminase-like putative cysteine protease